MASLKETIQAEVKNCMKAKEKARLAVLRLLTAEIKQKEVDQRITLDDQAVLAVLDKMVKQRRESIRQFEQAGRQDLVEQENYELTVLQAFLPKALSDEEIEQLIDEAMAQSGASTVRDMGKVMALLKPQMQGKADLGQVSAKVKSKLSPA